LITKAGVKCVFEEPAAIVDNAVVGNLKLTEWGKFERLVKQEVSIPLSEVERVAIWGSDPRGTKLLLVGIGIFFAIVLIMTVTQKPTGFGI
jgi:hypothetical protein